MSKYILSCCSTVDLSQELLDSRDIHYIGLHYILDGQEHIDDMGKTLPMKDFYAAMAAGAETTTAQINVEEYRHFFGGFLERGLDVIHVTLSSGLSGSYNSARIAAEFLADEYPDRKLFIVDSLGASSGSGMIVTELADMRDAGASIEELYEWAQEHKLEQHHWFFSSDLTFFVKGGRITKAAGWFGTALKICPVLNMDNLGRLIPRFKMRGKQNALKEVVRQMEEHAQDGNQYSGNCYISQSDRLEDAQALAALIEKSFPQLKNGVKIFDIGPTIGSHTGPGTVALFFWGDKRIN